MIETQTFLLRNPTVVFDESEPELSFGDGDGTMDFSNGAELDVKTVGGVQMSDGIMDVYRV